MNVAAALGIATLVAMVAWRLKALAPTGVVAAVVVGLAILSPLGWGGLLVLGTFFLPSTVVSRLSSQAQGRGNDPKEIRDYRQVLANGGFAALGAMAEFRTPGLGLWLCTIGLAASAGDTWATALGGLSPSPPVDILKRQPVERGASGGVTWFGCSGGGAGASLVALAGLTAGGAPRLFLTAALAGTAAMLLDSVLGSAIQARFRCLECDRPTEQRVHRCGSRTQVIRGMSWFDNDVVNAVASGSAVWAGWVFW